MLPDEAFASLPNGLRKDLIAAFTEIVRNFTERRWEPSELNGGKLCEVAYSVVKGIADGAMPARAAKPRNLVDACNGLGKVSAAQAPRSVRIQIPRMLIALYEIRNNRNVGHVGGDVDPNLMDATCVLQMAKWVVAELIRILHDLEIDEATEIVDTLVERETPLIWKVGDVKRILRADLSRESAVLLLLHATPGEVSEADLFDWLEVSVASRGEYRRAVLRPAHKKRLIEYDEDRRTLTISPIGVDLIEKSVLHTA